MASIKFAGEVNLERCEIGSLASGKKIDVKNQILQLNVFEDIFSPFLTGTLSLSDSVDLTNGLPFSGEETLKLTISNPSIDVKINLDCYIYKMEDRFYVNERTVGYALHFISSEAIVDLNKKISRAYKGSITDIVKELVNGKSGLESKKFLNIESTPDNVKYVSNYWSPIKNIGFVAKHCNNKNRSPSFVFFENRTGFNYISLESLYQQNVTQSFSYNNFTRQNTGSTSSKNIEEDFKRIYDITAPKTFDYMEDISSGKYASKMISYDLTTKRFKVEAYDFSNNFGKEKHLNQFPPVSAGVTKRYNSFLVDQLIHYDVHTGYGITTFNHANALRRQSLFLQAKSNVVNITVPGRCDYTVGQKVELTIYKTQPVTQTDSNDDIKDKILSGYYIIAAINHTVNRDRHECDMELIKDTIMFDLRKGN